MVTQEAIREIALSLPGVEEGQERFSFHVYVKAKAKGFLWTWAERVHPKKARVINDSVVAVVVPNLTAKEMLMQSNPEVYFEDDHYKGYPAVLVRLERAEMSELRALIVEAWKCKAPKELVAGSEFEH